MPAAHPMDRPFVYRVFHVIFSSRKGQVLSQELRREASAAPLHVVDVGCGPGTNAGLFLDKSRFAYLGLDINPDYIQRAQSRFSMDFECADITRDWKPTRRYDVVLINSLLHHLTDTEADAVLSAAAGCLAPGGRCLVMDMVYPEVKSILNVPRRMLIALDRGKYCRTAAHLEEMLTRHFHFPRADVFFLPYQSIRLWKMKLYVCRKK